MAEQFVIKQGDTSPAIRYALLPETVDLTGASVQFQMRTKGGPIYIDSPATIITATGTPTVQYDWLPNDTAVPGQYEAEFRVTYADATVETFPNLTFILVKISGDIR